MKATLSANPVSFPNDCIISAIYGGNKRLTFIQPGDKAWTYIDRERYTLIFDVIYYKGQIFAVDYWNGIIMVDLNTRVGENYDDDDFQHKTDDCLVFKVILQKINEEGWPEQVEVKSLDGDTLFLGDNHSVCVSASKWPGCQPNSIYYTDDYIDVKSHLPHGRRDIGIFNVENDSFGTHYILDPSHKHMPPSIWIVPIINGN
ncbi:uncharacterized protein LOC132277790 [Cornus florida]|uniref:uncharacterized protein LOC132277790 n=1 Tax=Cornus florida TaxID=4283 RepID=UPI00289CDC76|nr:uncharacterized protein LOC132277790 [Cornus florida]